MVIKAIDWDHMGMVLHMSCICQDAELDSKEVARNLMNDVMDGGGHKKFFL